MKEVRLSHIILVVGRVDVRVEDSRVRQGVESYKLFFFCVPIVNLIFSEVHNV